MANEDEIPPRVVSVALTCDVTARVLQTCLAYELTTDETLIRLIEELSTALKQLRMAVQYLERNRLPLDLLTPRNDNDDG